jgi:hypothetical protein
MFFNVVPLVAANILLWIFLKNENLNMLIASYAIKDAVTAFEFVTYAANWKEPRVRVPGACPFMLDVYQKKPSVPSTTGGADQPAVNPLNGMTPNPHLRLPRGNNCNSVTFQGNVHFLIMPIVDILPSRSSSSPCYLCLKNRFIRLNGSNWFILDDLPHAISRW